MNAHFHTPHQQARATQEYQNTYQDCANLLNRIQEHLTAKGQNLSWPSLGGVKSCRNTLIEALACIGGLTEEEMQKYHI